MRVFRSSALTILLLLVPALVFAQDDAEIQAASAEWLTLIDAEDYTGSLEASGQLMREAVTPEQWQQALAGVNAQLAAIAGEPIDLTQREVVEVTTIEDVPELPEGDYRAIRYRTTQGEFSFAEVVTLQDESGTWKVIGYFVAPEEAP